MENNYSGYKDKVQPDSKKEFDVLTKKLLRKAGKTHKLHYCMGLLKEWLTFFKDGHIRLTESNAPATKDSMALERLIQETEVIQLDEKKLQQLNQSTGIEGIYYTADSTYKIALIKNKSIYRDFAGVILHSKTPLWKPGQVKLELKEWAKNKFIGYAYYKDHSGHAADFWFDGNTLNQGAWIKQGFDFANNRPPAIAPIQTKRITETTFCIQIGSFDHWNANAIDSVFKMYELVLKSTPNLILDLRGNEGGVDFAYAPILPYIYTNPVYNIGVDVIASDDNIKAWLDLLNEPELPESTKNAILEMTAQMKLHPGMLVNIVPDDTTTLEKIEPFPKKVAVLIDSRCASSTEQFLLAAKQSKKVILFGQNTKGVLDYANVRTVAFPNAPLILAYPTTRSRRIDMGQGIEHRGIKPNVYLPLEKDWITEAMKYLEE